jgi:CRP-like cAMP-binding protein
VNLENKNDNLMPFSQADLRELTQDGLPKKCAKGESIWMEGDEPESIWVLKSGRSNMVIESSEGSASIVHFCTKAQAFCPAAAISGRNYPCSAVAATEVEAVAVPRSKFMALFNRMPQLAKSLLKQMAPLMCQSHCDRALSTAPVRDRLATVVGRLHEQYHGAQIPFTRQELANMSGTTVETTIRTMTQWEKQGFIQSQRGSFKVTRPAELEMVA